MRMQSELEEESQKSLKLHFTRRYLYVHILKAVLDLSWKTSSVKKDDLNDNWSIYQLKIFTGYEKPFALGLTVTPTFTHILSN